ncbi:hypothetical protein SUGI_0507770 [Cryptomeria japonica]|nr:hypothetical protein SUGI_0507770 [Cryptomeria japonica]
MLNISLAWSMVGEDNANCILYVAMECSRAKNITSPEEVKVEPQVVINLNEQSAEAAASAEKMEVSNGSASIKDTDEVKEEVKPSFDEDDKGERLELDDKEPESEPEEEDNPEEVHKEDTPAMDVDVKEVDHDGIPQDDEGDNASHIAADTAKMVRENLDWIVVMLRREDAAVDVRNHSGKTLKDFIEALPREWISEDLMDALLKKGIQLSMTIFDIGDWVKFKKNVKVPKYGSQGAKHKSVGFVQNVPDKDHLIVSFCSGEASTKKNRWMEMFPCIISRANTVDVISSGVGGTRNGALQLMYAELQVLSPLVPTREIYFARFCKQRDDGLWGVVDVSVDCLLNNPDASLVKCRKCPSGCLLRDMPNGHSKVIWVEYAEHDNIGVHRIFRSVVNSGMAFGAQRWLATLQRQCERIAFLAATNTPIPARDITAAVGA